MNSQAEEILNSPNPRKDELFYDVPLSNEGILGCVTYFANVLVNSKAYTDAECTIMRGNGFVGQGKLMLGEEDKELDAPPLLSGLPSKASEGEGKNEVGFLERLDELDLLALLDVGKGIALEMKKRWDERSDSQKKKKAERLADQVDAARR